MGKRRTYRLASLPVVLRQFRKRLPKMTQEKVGERLGVSNTYISKLEKGKEYPSIGMLVRIAKALEVRPGELLDAISDQEDALQKETLPPEE